MFGDNILMWPVLGWASMIILNIFQYFAYERKPDKADIIADIIFGAAYGLFMVGVIFVMITTFPFKQHWICKWRNNKDPQKKVRKYDKNRYIYKPKGARVHIETRVDRDIYFSDTEMVKQMENVSKLPFVFHHVFQAPDGHRGFGMSIGGVAAFKGVISPYCVGKDISCGMLFFKTSIKVADINKDFIIKLREAVKKVIPVGKRRHKEPQDEKYLPTMHDYLAKYPDHRDNPIFLRDLNISKVSVGTLGGGNHFIEFQETDDGYLGIMIHSGSRNLGSQICDFYDKIAIDLNEKWFSSVPRSWKLGFLPMNSREGQAYYSEMLYATDFAQCNRNLMALRIKEVIDSMVEDVTYEEPINISHNFARMENHFGSNVMVHRKGATSARKGELGIIPGSQGSSSYIVEGLGNPDSFESCSHGGGRDLSRKAAQKKLNLEEEIKILDDQGIVHGITKQDHLEEATGAYKNIDDVMSRQTDLVTVKIKLRPLGVIKED
jgi:tRNA-splicing ligase RtcB